LAEGAASTYKHDQNHVDVDGDGEDLDLDRSRHDGNSIPTPEPPSVESKSPHPVPSPDSRSGHTMPSDRLDQSGRSQRRIGKGSQRTDAMLEPSLEQRQLAVSVQELNRARTELADNSAQYYGPHAGASRGWKSLAVMRREVAAGVPPGWAENTGI